MLNFVKQYTYLYKNKYTYLYKNRIYYDLQKR